MPTVVLLDRSLSMRRPASRDNRGQTRHELACRGLEWFFDHLAESFPLEYTCLLSFSASCDVLHPFTRNYAQLKDTLKELPVLDRTNLHNALAAITDIVIGEWGPFAPCQAVVVTDGSPGVVHQDSVAKRQLSLNFPFPLQLHVVCVATREELLQPQWASKMDRLCDTVGLPQSDIFVPSSPLGIETVLTSFQQLGRAHFTPCTLSLKCGHLQSRISLVPSPTMYRSKFDIGITSDIRYPRLDSCLKNASYPEEIVICGFLDASCVPAPPLYARHFVLDPMVAPEPAARTLSPNVAQNGKKPAEVVDASQKPSFRVLLHGSLKMESKVALIKLG